MLAEALISDYAEHNGGGHPIIGSAFKQALHTLLERPDLSLWETAGAVAVLGKHSREDLVAELTGTDPRTAADRLELLADSGLLHDGEFRHPDVRNTVLGSLPSVTRAQLHMTAAQLKHQRSASAIEVAEQLIAAEKQPQEWAIPVLRTAAEQAMLSDNVSLATRCLELAIAASTDESQRRGFLHSLIRITWRVNPSAASAYLETLRASAHNGTLARSDSLTLVRHSLWQGDRETFSRAHRVLTSDSIDSQSAAEISLAWQWHFGPIRPGNTAAEATSEGGATPWNQTAGSLVHVWKQGGSEASNASAERILANCSLGDNTLEALVTAIIALVHGAKIQRAEWWCSRLSAQAAQRGARTWQAMIDAIWASVILRRGDIDDATARAHGALDMLEGQSWGVSISYPLTTLLLADVAEGKFADAARTLQRPVPSAMFDTIGGLQYLRARGHFYLATNRALAAVSDFQKCQQSLQSWNIDSLSLMPWRCDLADANLRLGNTGKARELATQQLELSTDHNPHACGQALRVLAFACDPAERGSRLRQAMRYFSDVGDEFEVNKTRKLLGAGIAVPARTMPEKPIVAEPGDSTAITNAELRVAQLAALGRTNRQIGKSLFITVSTVEQHLTRVYRKLGISGRSALATKLGDLSPDADDKDQRTAC